MSHVTVVAGHLWQRIGSVSHGVLVGGVASAVVRLLSAGRRGLVALAPRFGALWWSAAACGARRAAGEGGEASHARRRGQASALGRESREERDLRWHADHEITRCRWHARMRFLWWFAPNEVPQ